LFPLALALAGGAALPATSNEEKLAAAQALSASGKEDEAIELLMAIDPDSAVMAEASEHFRTVAAAVARRSGSVCKRYVDAGQFDVAFERCARAVELTCPSPTGADPEIAKLYRLAGGKLGKADTSTCPLRYARFYAPPPPGPAERVAAWYPDPEVAKIVLGYYQSGQPREASAQLRKLRGRKAGSNGELEGVIRALESVDERWVSFQDLLAKGKRDLCAGLLKEAAEADAKVLPKGMQGFPVRQMAGLLAAEK
jgi:hypothetical protein